MLKLVTDIIELQKTTIHEWKTQGIGYKHANFLKIVEENHAFNFQLWHAEDRARREDMGHSFVYHAKREIDHCNQQRNNRMEKMDGWLFNEYKPASPTSCPVHSETPGMMIDRLSILALKIYHMHEQTIRQNVNEAHRQTCLQKLNILNAQQRQLATCLEDFLRAIKNKKRTFCMYHQFKMYNDPELNPELYCEPSAYIQQ